MKQEKVEIVWIRLTIASCSHHHDGEEELECSECWVEQFVFCHGYSHDVRRSVLEFGVWEI
jgi:hypothetical protein